MKGATHNRDGEERGGKKTHGLKCHLTNQAARFSDVCLFVYLFIYLFVCSICMAHRAATVCPSSSRGCLDGGHLGELLWPQKEPAIV